MDRDQQREGQTAWEDLALTLGGSFAARAGGLISPDLILLDRGGESFGRLTADEAGGTRLQTDGLAAWIQPSARSGYRMMTDDTETLTADPTGSAAALELQSGGRAYGARISLLHNNAVARQPDGGETARISGNLTNRRYEATFTPEDPASLPIAIFLLHHLFTSRSSAFRTG